MRVSVITAPRKVREPAAHATSAKSVHSGQRRDTAEGSTGGSANSKLGPGRKKRLGNQEVRIISNAHTHTYYTWIVMLTTM